jgi:hypothetical protein
MFSHCIVYRTGGTTNFRWNRSLAMREDQAIRAAIETQKMGYPALVVPFRESVLIGLPDTYETPVLHMAHA